MSDDPNVPWDPFQVKVALLGAATVVGGSIIGYHAVKDLAGPRREQPEWRPRTLGEGVGLFAAIMVATGIGIISIGGAIKQVTGYEVLPEELRDQ